MPLDIVGSVIVYQCMLCVSLSMDLFALCVACLTVFVNILVKQFTIHFGVVVDLLLNVKELFTVVGGALLYGLPQSVCVLCL